MLPTLRSFERRALIEQQVAFVVPGKQLYIPELAVDLREHFKQRRTEKNCSVQQRRRRCSPRSCLAKCGGHGTQAKTQGGSGTAT